MIRPSRSGTVPLALAATLLAGCDNPSSAPAPALGDPVAGLDAGAQGRFLLGRALFERLATPDEGLGPLFNAERCSDCHDQPVTGGGGIRIRVVRATRFAEGRCDLLEAEGGDNIQQRATDLLAAHDLGPERIPPSATATARVTAPPLFGLGLIDAIPDAVLLEAADPDDRDGDGISGRLPRLPDGRSARFGRKGDAHGLQDFVISALRFELGFTTPSQPDEIAVNGHPVPPAADPARDPEIDAVALGQLTDYMRFLAPPAPADLPSATARDSVARGEAIFRQIGCISCHRQEMRTAADPASPESGTRFVPPALADRSLRLWSDLLLHDMGAGLANTCGPDASPTELRTAPLWGLRHRSLFLHDGRASDLASAIRAHGGEAALARDAFLALPAEARAAVVRFLRSL